MVDFLIEMKVCSIKNRKVELKVIYLIIQMYFQKVKIHYNFKHKSKHFFNPNMKNKYQIISLTIITKEMNHKFMARLISLVIHSRRLIHL